MVHDISNQELLAFIASVTSDSEKSDGVTVRGVEVAEEVSEGVLANHSVVISMLEQSLLEGLFALSRNRVIEFLQSFVIVGIVVTCQLSWYATLASSACAGRNRVRGWLLESAIALFDIRLPRGLTALGALDTFRHLLVVAARWKSVLGRRDSLAKLLVFKINTLFGKKKSQLQFAFIDIINSNRLVISNTYLIKSSEISGAIVKDALRLITKDFTHEIVENVWELPWNGELLNVFRGHLT